MVVKSPSPTPPMVDESVVKHGPLIKWPRGRSKKGKSTKFSPGIRAEKYFVLHKNGTLYCYENKFAFRKGDAELGKIIIDSTTLVHAQKENPGVLVIKTKGYNKHKLESTSDDSEERDEWIKVIEEIVSQMTEAHQVPKSPQTVQVAVVGASGPVGTATLRSWLTQQNHLTLKGKHAEMRGITRDIALLEETIGEPLDLLHGVSIITGDMHHSDTLAKSLKGVERLLIVTPGHVDRTQLTLNAIEAAKAAGVGYVVIISLPSVAAPDSVFGSQMLPVEEALKASGLAYTILRCPLFYENQFGNIGALALSSSIFGPGDAEKAFSFISVQDIGRTAASLLADPEGHKGKIYSLVGSIMNNNEIALSYSRLLEKPVNYVQVPYDASMTAMVASGWPMWQAKGVLEMLKAIDEEAPYLRFNTKDVKLVTGTPAMTFDEWLDLNKEAFVSSSTTTAAAAAEEDDGASAADETANIIANPASIGEIAVEESEPEREGEVNAVAAVIEKAASPQGPEEEGAVPSQVAEQSKEAISSPVIAEPAAEPAFAITAEPVVVSISEPASPAEPTPEPVEPVTEPVDSVAEPAAEPASLSPVDVDPAEPASSAVYTAQPVEPAVTTTTEPAVATTSGSVDSTVVEPAEPSIVTTPNPSSSELAPEEQPKEEEAATAAAAPQTLPSQPAEEAGEETTTAVDGPTPQAAEEGVAEKEAAAIVGLPPAAEDQPLEEAAAEKETLPQEAEKKAAAVPPPPEQTDFASRRSSFERRASGATQQLSRRTSTRDTVTAEVTIQTAIAQGKKPTVKDLIGLLNSAESMDPKKERPTPPIVPVSPVDQRVPQVALQQSLRNTQLIDSDLAIDDDAATSTEFDECPADATTATTTTDAAAAEEPPSSTVSAKEEASNTTTTLEQQQQQASSTITVGQEEQAASDSSLERLASAEGFPPFQPTQAPMICCIVM